MVIAAVIISLVVALAAVAVMVWVSARTNERMEKIQRSIEDAYKAVGQNIGSATNMFGQVQQSLGRLEATNQQICEIGKSISAIQDLLRAPKFRGKMGETLLENILSQVLPKEFVQTQYRFKSQEAVDAVIKLGGRIVPIDAKFPLENFVRIQEIALEDEKNAARRKFVQDVKARIDEIAKKYILPDENTYDFAMMYVPAENVYYEIIIKEDLLTYALSKKVIPVSPNTFYAYLQVICLGLRGLEVEKNATQILKNLSTLSFELNKFKDDFTLVGSHLRNASTKYDDATKRIERFSDKLGTIQNAQPPEVLPTTKKTLEQSV